MKYLLFDNQITIENQTRTVFDSFRSELTIVFNGVVYNWLRYVTFSINIYMP